MEVKIKLEVKSNIQSFLTAVFFIFKLIHSFSLKEKEDSARIRERNILRMINFTEKNILHAAIQKNKLSNLRVYYPALLISKNFDSLVTAELILANQSMHAYRIKQQSLRDDLKKIHEQIKAS